MILYFVIVLCLIALGMVATGVAWWVDVLNRTEAFDDD